MWWWRKRYCEACSGEIAPDAEQVHVAGVPFHLACYPRAQAPDVTRYVRVRGNVYRVEYISVEWRDVILDTTVLLHYIEQIRAGVVNPRRIIAGRLGTAQFRRMRPATPQQPHYPRWLQRPVAR